MVEALLRALPANERMVGRILASRSCAQRLIVSSLALYVHFEIYSLQEGIYTEIHAYSPLL
jgi:hypothetical protein